MSFHLAAYFDTIAATGVSQFVKPVTDMYLPSTTQGFLLPTAMRVVAAYASSPEVGGSGLYRARVNAPSLLRVALPYIRPISHSLPENTDPNVMNLIAHPLALPASENVAIEAVGTAGAGATPNPVCALLWFCDSLTPAPVGETYVLRFTATSTPTFPGAWSPVGTMNFDQSLPAGVYTAVGLEHWSPNAIAARMVFPGMFTRPGTLSMGGGAGFQNSSNKRGERMFYEGGVGVFGSFNSFAPPSLEALTVASDTTHEGYLTVVRTGDVTSLSPTPGAPGGGGGAFPPGHAMSGAPHPGLPHGGHPFGAFGAHPGHHHHHPGAAPQTPPAGTPGAPGQPHPF
jgi:hypothetical protein